MDREPDVYKRQAQLLGMAEKIGGLHRGCCVDAGNRQSGGFGAGGKDDAVILFLPQLFRAGLGIQAQSQVTFGCRLDGLAFQIEAVVIQVEFDLWNRSGDQLAAQPVLFFEQGHLVSTAGGSGREEDTLSLIHIYRWIFILLLRGMDILGIMFPVPLL